jgi:hypothetical protein
MSTNLTGISRAGISVKKVAILWHLAGEISCSMASIASKSQMYNFVMQNLHFEGKKLIFVLGYQALSRFIISFPLTTCSNYFYRL